MTYKDFKIGQIIECHYFQVVMLEIDKQAPATRFKAVVSKVKRVGLWKLGQIDWFNYDGFKPVKLDI